MSGLDLDALDALCEAATPGPWRVADDFGDDDDAYIVCADGSVVVGLEWASDSYPVLRMSNEDARLFVEARTALPALVAELREARADLATVSATRQRGCDCQDDEACRFARERDVARAEVERLRGLLYGREVFVHGPDGVPHPGCPVCDALAPRVAT